MKYGIGLVAVLFAQYRVEAIIRQPYADTIPLTHAVLWLSPTALRYDLRSEYKGQPYHISLLFRGDSAFLLDHTHRSAYRLPVQKEPALPLERATPMGESSINGMPASTWALYYPSLRLIVAWSGTFDFDWSPWDRYLEADRIGAAARYFQKGLPLRIAQYEEEVLRWEMEVKKVERISEGAVPIEVPYPISPWMKSD